MKEDNKNQNNIPLLHKLEAFQQEENLSFHVPGHKNGRLWESNTYEAFRNFLPYDVTELEGLDDFHHPTECIKVAQDLLTDLYGSADSRFLVGGTTVGNLAAILSTCQAEDVVLVSRNSHKSVIRALKMAGVKPIFISNPFDETHGIEQPIEENTWIYAMKQYKNAKAIILTSPSYYGQWTSLVKIIETAHHYGMVVICDEAHGAHFILGEPFGVSAVTEGADVVIQSAHKTLAAMTMGSYIHIQEHFPYKEKLDFYLNALQSSSPSYPIMASLDYARHHLAKIMEQSYDEILQSIQAVEQILSDHTELKVIHPSHKKDPLKIWVAAINGVSGYELQKAFHAVGIYPELATQKFVLLIHPLGVFENINQLQEKISRLAVPEAKIKEQPTFLFALEAVLPFSESYAKLANRRKEMISFEQSEGRLSAHDIIPYPPGIPLIMDGERITREKIETLNHLIKINVTIEAIQHFKEGMIQVYEEDK